MTFRKLQWLFLLVLGGAIVAWSAGQIYLAD
jgi:hypothetical protein